MIRFDRIPIHTTTAENGQIVPYLEIAGEDEPIEYLFTLGDKYGLIARANLHTLRGAPKTGKSAAGLALIAAALKGDKLHFFASEFISSKPLDAPLKLSFCFNLSRVLMLVRTFLSKFWLSNRISTTL